MCELANPCKQDEAGRVPESDSEAAVPALQTKPVYSEKLTRMLIPECTAAIQAVIMKRPDVALAAHVHRLACRFFRGLCS